MSYAPNYCDEELGQHVITPCLTDRELGRVRTGGFIRKSYLSTLLTGADNPQVWQDGIDSGDIIVVPDTAGTFDPGEPAELRGYGDRATTNGPRTMTLTFFDPDYKQNYAFYNGISKQTNLVPFYRTSSLVHIFDTVASIDARDPVEDDVESEVVWEVVCTVVSENLPSKHDLTPIASIFNRLNF